MKYSLILALGLLTTACGDRITLEDITQASAICEKNGGTRTFSLSIQASRHMYVSSVHCVDGARFEDKRLWETKE